MTTAADHRIVWEAFQDLVDPLEYLHDTPGWRSQYSSSYRYADRKAGELGPIIECEQDLTTLRGMARAIADVSVFAKSALTNLGNYVIGRGLVYKATAKRNSDNAISDETLRAVNRTIAEFLARTEWHEASKRRRILRRQRRDGEILVAVYPMGDGRCNIRLLEPGLLRAPLNPDKAASLFGVPDGDWNFGVHTDPEDPETIYGYNIQWSDKPDDATYFPPSRFHHVRCNVDDDVKRGLTDFYPVERYLYHAGKLLSNTVQGAAILSAIAAIIEHPKGISASQIESFATAERYTYQNESTPHGQRTKQIHKYNPGTFMHVPEGQVYHSSPLANRGVGDAMVLIDQAVLRAVGVNWCMPEYMISGDASNNNYASIMEAGTPFVEYVSASQGECAEEDAKLLWKILRVAHQSRLLGAVDFEELHAAVEIQIDGPQVGRRQTPEATNRRKLLVDAGAMSLRTWQTQEDLDPEVEAENGAQAKPEPQPLGFGQSAGLPSNQYGDPRDRDKDGIYPESLGEAAREAWRGYPLVEAAGEVWRTINGVPVLIDKDGAIIKGPKGMLGRKSKTTGSKPSKPALAKRTHKPSTAAKQRKGEAEQLSLSKALPGAVNTDDNKEFDIILGKHCVEVKTLLDNDNDKITVHPESRRRKEKFARNRGMKMHTVAIDTRGGRRSYYYKAGVGAYRISAMERVSVATLKERLQ